MSLFFGNSDIWFPNVVVTVINANTTLQKKKYHKRQTLQQKKNISISLTIDIKLKQGNHRRSSETSTSDETKKWERCMYTLVCHNKNKTSILSLFVLVLIAFFSIALVFNSILFYCVIVYAISCAVICFYFCCRVRFSYFY